MKVQTINIAKRLVKHMIANWDNANYNAGPPNDSQRIQAANDSADYTHWPNIGPTDDSQRIQAAYDKADYTNWPNVGPTYDSQRIQAANDSADYTHWPNVGPTDLANVFYNPLIAWIVYVGPTLVQRYKTNPNQKPTVRPIAYVGPT